MFLRCIFQSCAGAQPAPTPPPILPNKYNSYNSPMAMANVSNTFVAVLWSYPPPNAVPPYPDSHVYSYVLGGSGTWLDSPTPYTMFADSGGAAIGPKVYSFGGSLTLNYAPVRSVFEITMNEGGGVAQIIPCAILPVPLCSVTAVSYGNVIYLVGGYSANPIGSIYMFDPSGDCTSAKYSFVVGLFGPARSGVAAGMIGPRMVIAGGKSASAFVDTVEVYDVLTGEHYQLPPLSQPLGSPAGTVANCLVCACPLVLV